jgi:hypothetical protein
MMRIQPPAGRAVAVGRDGQPIWRLAAPVGVDRFAIPPEIVDEGWVYEWKRWSVAGQPDHAYQTQLRRIGRWEPVQAERHPGVFMPPGSTGDIIIDGLILMERPLALHREAQREERLSADDVMLKARRERGLKVPAGATGVDPDNAEARGATYVNATRVMQSADDMAALQEIPKPAYDYSRNTID